MANARRVVALGHSLTRFIPHQIAVIVIRTREFERPRKQDLARRRLQKVRAAYDFRNPHLSVVHHDCQLIGRYIVSSPDDEVSKVSPGGEVLWSKMYVIEGDFLAIRHAKAPVHTLGLRELICIGTGTAQARIERLVVGIVRRARDQCQFFSRTSAGIDPAIVPQATPRGQVGTSSFTLRVRAIGSIAVWAFLPTNSQPMQVVDHSADELGKATLRIKVFVAKNENAVLLASALGGDEKRARVPEMQVSGRRRRQSPAIWFGEIAGHPFTLLLADWNGTFNQRRNPHIRWELPFPSSHYHGCQAIAEYVYCGSSHIHKLIDAEQDEDRLDRKPERSHRP